MVELVETILHLNKQLSEASSESSIQAIQRQIDATDAEIDRISYDLYGLTADEISIVEGKR